MGKNQLLKLKFTLLEVKPHKSIDTGSCGRCEKVVPIVISQTIQDSVGFILGFVLMYPKLLFDTSGNLLVLARNLKSYANQLLCNINKLSKKFQTAILYHTA